MRGQWLGECTGTNTGSVVLNVDDLGNRFRGVIYFRDDAPTFPPMVAVFEVNDHDEYFTFSTTELCTVSSRLGDFASWDVAKSEYFSGMLFPTRVDVSGKKGVDSLELYWKTDIETNGRVFLHRSSGSKNSEVESTILTWSEYKNYALSSRGCNLICVN